MNEIEILKRKITQRIRPRFKGFTILIMAFVLFLVLLNFKINKTTVINVTVMNGSNYTNNLKIYCLTLTSPKGSLKKIHTIHKTWASECDNHSFIAKLNDTLPHTNDLLEIYPFLELTDLIVDDYKALACKMYHAFREVYRKNPNYDWYLKTDDDTYIFMDHLREFLATQNSSEPITFGYNYKDVYEVERGYHSGGAGYVLSGEALRRLGAKLNENISFCERCRYEDMNVARCLRKLKVYPGVSLDNEGRERFHLFDIPNQLNGRYPDWVPKYAANPVRVGRDSVSETRISFHYMKPDDMMKVHGMYRRYLNRRRLQLKLMSFSRMIYDMFI